MRYWVVMPAAGIGRRFGTDRPKQYAALCGRTVIEWALGLFLTDPRCAGAVVALARDDPYWTAIAPPSVLVAAGGQE
ncbi:MAG TPA: 2-C-methyl-D-erythritol 4-phosphate cytidylyltransferase, partial [Steroidobacteraceae bacterium]|nr:2-C-methyl-D-erythritol 4-phosphate cytidylyltransferase [Steroidobacteraceae bacterium]